MNPTDISLFQESFPVNREMIWLNNCGTTPASTHNLKAVSTFLDGYSKHGIFTETEKFFSVKQEIKTKLVELCVDTGVYGNKMQKFRSLFGIKPEEGSEHRSKGLIPIIHVETIEKHVIQLDDNDIENCIEWCYHETEIIQKKQ